MKLKVILSFISILVGIYMGYNYAFYSSLNYKIQTIEDVAFQILCEERYETDLLLLQNYRSLINHIDPSDQKFYIFEHMLSSLEDTIDHYDKNCAW